MDYDDTDFQSQNFRLAGEDNSKFPSGLRPFALPKLDIDDQLQSHLRFDNLIDSEGFFSVQGHDNSWIEVLSTGSSVVDFSSSAAESCSISRTNNVWSEATSTESVEMLLKSVGENEMTGKIDGSVHHQLSAMDSQTDPSNMQPKSSNSPTGNTVVPAEYDQSQSIRSKMMEDPSRIHPQLEHITSFSMDGKADQAIGSTLSDMESDYMLVAHDSGKLNNEPFSDLAPLQNIYATNSYHFEQDNQESGICVTPQDSETLHMNESKVEGLHELQNLPCTRQPLGTTALSSEISNETLLSESSDGLLQAITNPVKMLHMRNDTCKRASATLQPTFLQVEHVTAGLEDSVDRRHEPLVKDFGFSEETNSAESHQSEPESINLSPRITTLSSTKSGELIQSPKGEQLAQATGAPEEPTNDDDANIDRSNEPLLEDIGISEEHIAAKCHQSEPESINLNPHIVSVLSTKSGELIQSPKGEQLAHVEEAMNDGVDDANISTGDDPKLGVLEHYQDSVDNLQSGLMEEKTIREDLPAVSRNIEQMVDSGHDENATGVISTSEDKLESSGNIVPQNSPASLLDEKDPSISSVDHEGSFKEGAAAALEDDLGNQHPASPYSDHQEKKSTQSNISRSNIDSTAVIDALGTSEDKPDCSVSLALDGSSAGMHDERISSVNDEGSPKEGGESALEVVGHSVTSAVSDPLGNTSAASVSPNINALCSSGSDTVTKTPECEERATSLGSLKISETQDKSGDRSDGYRQKFQTDVPLTESEHHKDLVAPSTVGVSSDMDVEEAVKTPLNGNDDLNTHLQDHTPGTISSEDKVGLEPGGGDGSSADATCGSPTVISCTEPCPQEDGHGSNSLLHHTPTEQSEDVGAAIDANQRSKEIIKPVVSSEENNTTGDDRSFSFEVGAPPIVPEKAHSPAWSPLPRSEASQSTKTTTEIPKPASPSGNPSKNISDDSKKISAVETGKDQLSGRKVVRSAGAPSISSHIGDSTALVVYQPFTDLQHVQLRAQIFVYGALIQGIPPAEAYMISAFGEPGGGKPAWEAVWRAAVERFQNQKSPFTALDTPTSSCIGSRVTEKASIGTAVKTAPASKRFGKTVLPPHTAVTLNSPTFNMSPLGSSTLHLQRGTHLDFSQVVSPVLPSQTRQPTSGAASWFPQNPGPRPAPWLVPPQNLIFDSSMQSAVPTIETAKGASSKNISTSQSVSPAAFPPSQTPIVSPPLAVKHEEKQKTSHTSKRGATTQKSRKRKKASASPEQQTDNSFPQLKTDIASVTPATKRTPGFTLSTHSPNNVLGTGLVSDTGLISSVPNYQITVGKYAEQKMIFSEQIHGAIEQSLGQAKTASMHSMEAVGHSEGIWNHLSTNCRGNLPVEVEGKLASAAAAASAAVSVAKAAAEAARMASEAALQARMMAEEALSVNSLHVNDSGVNSSLAIVPSLTPTSSWKLKDSSHAPGSIISVAREVARKRVEEASAAAKRAENLDEILKAAELAAEAVFKAGTIIGMGEPIPFTLSELLEAGPDGYWKSDLVRNKKVGNAKNNPLAEQSEVPIDLSKSGRKRGGKTQNLEPSSIAKELQTGGVQSGNGVDDAPTTAPLDGIRHCAAPNISWNGIEKGSVVEVLADKGGFGVAWFSATVLDLNEDSACISYYTISEGSGLRKEWLPLKQEGEKAPQIRLPHPATISSFKGTRKRRRDMAGSYSWTVGDHVEAWTRDSWREGIISQNCESDETKFVVQFSGVADDTLVVDAWNLRPSLVWKDGQWTEWSRAQEKKVKSNKGDSPYEKRQRTESMDHVPMGAEAAGPSMDKGTNNGTKPEEPKPLALLDKDMVFNIGKSIVEKKTGGVASRRPGLQKEGSRVVGVPKHGKKKKFMEVSKHYDADQADKISDGNMSTRLARHGMPHVQRPQESTSRVDQKAKKIAEMRSRGLKSTKSQNVATNTIPGKGTLSMPVPSSGVFQSSSAFAGSTTGSSNTMNHSVQKNSSAHGIGLRAEDASVSETHVQASSTAPTSKKNSTTTDRAKRKYVPSTENLNRSMVKYSELPGKSNSDSSEPRRSNRRIQPTSRLLEGLQSSLVVSKVPGEKGPRTNYRSASSRGRTLG